MFREYTKNSLSDREFTMNSVSLPRLHYEFTNCVAYSLHPHQNMMKHQMKIHMYSA